MTNSIGDSKTEYDPEPDSDERITSGDTAKVEVEVLRRTNTGVLHVKTDRGKRLAVSSEIAEKVEETDDE